MRCNLRLLTVQAALVLWAHAVGASWPALALLLVGLALVACAGLAYFFRVHMPRAHRRHEDRLRRALAEHALLVHVHTVEHPARPALPPAGTVPPLASERDAA